MVRVNSPQSQNKNLGTKAQHEPPNLPAYVADSFELKAIVGAPTDDEIKVIHAVIRVVENVSIGNIQL